MKADEVDNYLRQLFQEIRAMRRLWGTVEWILIYCPELETPELIEAATGLEKNTIRGFIRKNENEAVKRKLQKEIKDGN